MSISITYRFNQSTTLRYAKTLIVLPTAPLNAVDRHTSQNERLNILEEFPKPDSPGSIIKRSEKQVLNSVKISGTRIVLGTLGEVAAINHPGNFLSFFLPCILLFPNLPAQVD